MNCEQPSRDVGHRIVAYAFKRPLDLSTLDVTKVTHLHYAFGLIYNNEYLEINPVTGKVWGSPANLDVLTPEPVPEGKLHTIYLSEKVKNDLERLPELWAKNPDLKILLAIGGWEARGFCDAAATDESRRIFSTSCKEIVDKYNLNGIDLAWEYPMHGAWGTIKGAGTDRRNFTLLLQEVRNALGPDRLLTATGSANEGYVSEWIEFQQVIALLDYVNIMTYDFQYSTYFGSGLYSSKQWSVANVDLSVDLVIQDYIKKGCPPKKINLGLALAARIPRVVGASLEFGEISARLSAAGFFNRDEPELQKVKRLENQNGFFQRWDEDAQNMYITVILDDDVEHFVLSYLETRSIAIKCEYAKKQGLGGLSIWHLGIDYQNEVVTQLYEKLYLDP